MRLIAMSLGVVGLAVAWGCKPPPKDVTELRFKNEVRRYFSNLNSENELRREALRREQTRAESSPVYQPPAGMMYSTYVFEPEQFVVTNYKCRACGVRLTVLNPVLEYLCPSCHHSPYLVHAKGTDLRKSPCTMCVGTEHKIQPPDEKVVARDKFEALKEEGVAVKGMFELTQEDTSKPLEAVVRYVRRSWAWDSRGTVQVSQKALEKAVSDAKYIPVADGSEGTNQPGFHRLDASYLGEMKFQLKGENLVLMEGPREEPVRLWKDLKTIK